MMFLPGLAVVFAGIAGNSDHRVDKQLRALAADLHVAPAKVSAGDLAIIGHHGEGARAVIQRMHADGVITGEYIVAGGHATVRLIVYGGDGGLRSLSEMPLAARVLGADELQSVRDNLADEVAAMMPAASAAKPLVNHPAAAAVVDDDVPAAVAPPPRVATKPKAAPVADAPRRRRAPDPTPAALAEPDFTIDPPATAAPDAAAAVDTTAAPEHDADAVSVADMEAMTSGGDATTDGVAASATSASPPTISTFARRSGSGSRRAASRPGRRPSRRTHRRRSASYASPRACSRPSVSCCPASPSARSR